ncbi:hypothetical protein PR048_024165 [Dryococelus australis]|uniref:Uncharacterized protein n=1 Tax=Dryococelus australis TaxID=614101 RepID=A0ABQ9GW38_9NEOP|nr:hypothetical protein PR048_024165 [Dryococelus australis]
MREISCEYGARQECKSCTERKVLEVAAIDLEAGVQTTPKVVKGTGEYMLRDGIDTEPLLKESSCTLFTPAEDSETQESLLSFTHVVDECSSHQNLGSNDFVHVTECSCTKTERSVYCAPLMSGPHDSGTFSIGTKWRGKREIPEKTRRPAALSDTAPTCGNQAVTRPRNEPAPPLWKTIVVRLLASHQGEPNSVPDWVTPGFSNVGIVPDDAAAGRVYSGMTPLHSGVAPYSLQSPSSALETNSFVRLVQTWSGGGGGAVTQAGARRLYEGSNMHPAVSNLAPNKRRLQRPPRVAARHRHDDHPTFLAIKCAATTADLDIYRDLVELPRPVTPSEAHGYSNFKWGRSGSVDRNISSGATDAQWLERSQVELQRVAYGKLLGRKTRFALDLSRVKVHTAHIETMCGPSDVWGGGGTLGGHVTSRLSEERQGLGSRREHTAVPIGNETRGSLSERRAAYQRVDTPTKGMHAVDKHTVDRHAVDKHTVDRHAVDKHTVDRHAVDKHTVDRHAVDKHTVDRHAVDKHTVDRHAVDKHTVDMHAVDKHTVDMHAVDKHTVDRHAVDKHTVDRHAVDKHTVDRHAVDKHTVDMHAVDKHTVDRHAVDKHTVDRHAVDKHTVDRHAVDKHTVDRHAVDKHTVDRHAVDKHTVDRHAVDKHTVDRHAVDKHTVDRHAVDKHTVDRHAVDKHTVDRHAVDKHTVDRHAVDKHTVDRHAVDKHTVDRHAVDKHTVDRHAVDKHTVDRHAVDKHTVDRHAVDKHTVDRHAVDKHTVDRHAVDKHTVDRHAVDKHTVDRHAVDKHTVDRHAVDKHTVDRHAVDKHIQSN